MGDYTRKDHWKIGNTCLIYCRETTGSFSTKLWDDGKLTRGICCCCHKEVDLKEITRR